MSRPFDIFCKGRDAMRVFRALKLKGLRATDAMTLTVDLTGIKESRIKYYDIETRDAMDGSGKKAKVMIQAATDKAEINCAVYGLIKWGWYKVAKDKGIIGLLIK